MSNLFWFRRDLRIEDNVGLAKSLNHGATLCCFIWDSNILNQLDADNPRVAFIHQSLIELNNNLTKLGTKLIIRYGEVSANLDEIIRQYQINNVFCNEDYEPFSIKRDLFVQQNLCAQKIGFYSFKDHLIFAKNDILKPDNTPYTVFSFYKKAWLNKFILDPYHIQVTPIKKKQYYKLSQAQNQKEAAQWQEITDRLSHKFTLSCLVAAGITGATKRLDAFTQNLYKYDKTRDIPSLDSTSRIGVDLRFGTVSIRSLIRFIEQQRNANNNNEGYDTWLNELIWREFFSQILYHFPHVQHQSFKPEFKNIKFSNNQEWFLKWCCGKTGYPIVDAGMRELNSTGFMHNRVRMITASFLIKDLLIDWRYGEQYFAKKLLDYDLASNNGNWQWCASTGCDSQPYFRIFNPSLQSKKFDPDAIYIKRHIPELAKIDSKHIHDPISLKSILNQDLFMANNTYLKNFNPIVEHGTQVKITKQLYNASKLTYNI